jgi:heat shock protein HslJ
MAVAGDGSGGPAPTLDAPTLDALAGRSFSSVSVTEGGEPRPLVPGTTVQLSFDTGSVQARAGCNLLSGAVTIEDGTLVTDGHLMATEMGCDAPRHAQDEWLGALLVARPALTLDGDGLVLRGGDPATVITLVDQRVAVPDRPLTGTTWRLTGFVDGVTAFSAPANPPVDLVVEGATLSVSVGDGCAARRDVTASDDALVVRPGGPDAACADAEAEQLRAEVLAVLEAGPATRIDGAALTLTAGASGLTFRAG